MKRQIQRVACAMLIAFLVACSTAPKVTLRPEVKQSVKRIAIVDIPEPTTYFMHPGAVPGGAALYAFGAIGGAILGGIEASRQEAASARFTSAVSPLKPALSTVMLERLESGLKEKGYDVVRIPEPSKTADGKAYDFARIEGNFDAILVASLGAGYTAESGAVVPRVRVGATLHARSGIEKLFSDTYIYSSMKIGELTRVEPDPKFTMSSIDAMYQNVGMAVEGLRTGTGKLAERILVDL